MRTLIKNGMVINVFTDEIEKADVLIEDNRIIGVGDFYTDSDADRVDDVSGMYICPGFIVSAFLTEQRLLLPTLMKSRTSAERTESTICSRRVRDFR